MSQQRGLRRGRGNKRSKVEFCPVVSINKVVELGDFFIASIGGIDFFRLEYGHNQLLEALNNYLRVTLFDQQVATLMEEDPSLPPERAEDLTKELLGHHAAGVTVYISNNIQFMFGSMLETFLNIGGLWANQDKERQLGEDPPPITANQIKTIFADLALQHIQRQAGGTGGRRPDIAKEKWKRKLEFAATRLRKERRKLIYEEAADVLNVSVGTLKGAVGRHDLGSYWKELKRSSNLA